MKITSENRSKIGLANTVCGLSLLFFQCTFNETESGLIDDLKLSNADQFPHEWLSYGRNYQENRHSPLDQINKSNIDSLGLAWSLDLGTRRGLEATPLVAKGVMYFTSTWSKVWAVDAGTGEALWTYDPQVPREWGEKLCCDVVNRGVAIFKDTIYFGTLDGRLIALNAHTGAKVWEVLTVDQTKAYSITGAPRIVKGNVIIGNGGAEFGTRGYVTAYHALTGRQVWRFYTVPGNPEEPFESQALEEAAKTWTGEWWQFGGGGTVWDAMAFDPELNLLYIGTGNGSPWNRNFRSPDGGDNLYLSSIIALNPDNGQMVWYYQTTPGDTWDFTATQHLILADLHFDGSARKVLMQAPKNGFFYVLDRITGELISAEPYVYTNWATSIDKSTGRPLETPFARYPNINAQLAPGPGGGHNWQPMAYNSKTGLVYIPAREDGSTFGQPQDWQFIDDARTFNTGRRFNPALDYRQDSLAARDFGKLIAWDPVAQKEIWSVWQKSSWNAGVLTTDELVFQGNAEGYFSAYDADTGEKLWSINLKTGIIAPPITYEVDGRQYVSILVGWGGFFGLFNKFTEQINPGTLYTFALGGSEKLPDFPKQPKKELVNLDFEASDADIAEGRKLFEVYCERCHGGGVIPDLTYSSEEVFHSFQLIVGNGAYAALGMPGFGDRLSELEIQNIKRYILSEARSKINN